VFALVLLVGSDEMEKLFYLLILSFRESICLWVCYGGEVPVNAKFFSQRSAKLGYKSGISDQNDSFRKSKPFVDMVEI